MANSTIKENAISRLINTRLYYDATNKYFPIPTGTRKPNNNANFQLTLAARNTNTGAIYIIWYDWTSSAFRIASIISGNVPTEGQAIDISYLGGVKRYLCELLAGVRHDECDKTCTTEPNGILRDNKHHGWSLLYDKGNIHSYNPTISIYSDYRKSRSYKSIDRTLCTYHRQYGDISKWTSNLCKWDFNCRCSFGSLVPIRIDCAERRFYPELTRLGVVA